MLATALTLPDEMPTLLPVPEQTALVRLPSPDNFEAYARAAHAAPLLSEEAEGSLIEAWRQRHDAEAAKHLVMAHLRLVVRVVRDHKGYGLSPGDMAQEGTVGLMRAIHKFDPAVGVRLATYAVHWIEAEIKEWIFRNLRMVRLASGKVLRKLFFGYRSTVERLKGMGVERDTPVRPRDIAQVLDVPEEAVREVMGYWEGTDEALPSPGEGETDTFHAVDRLGLEGQPSPYSAHNAWESDPAHHAEVTSHQRMTHQALHTALRTLSDRTRAIVEARSLQDPPQSLQVLAEQWGISLERVRQIHQEGLKRLTQAVHTAVTLPSQVSS